MARWLGSTCGHAHTLKRRARQVIAANQPGALAHLRPELHRGLEEVLEEPQISLQGVEGLPRLGAVVAVPADELAHMGPVLLLHMGIVGLLVGPGAARTAAGFTATTAAAPPSAAAHTKSRTPPRPAQHPDHRRAVAGGPYRRAPWAWAGGQRVVQQPAGVGAVIAADGAIRHLYSMGRFW